MMFDTATRNHPTKAFTLLELAVVMALIGLVLAGGLITFTAAIQSTQYNATVATMGAIDQALLNYSVSQGRIPCPSNLTCVAGNLNYGAEGSCTSSTASCTSGTTGVNFISLYNAGETGVAEGGVPTRALRLPDSYQYDAWGNRINYAVDPLQTITGALPVGRLGSGCRFPSTTGIIIYDASGATRTSTAAYALYSHGQNGHGAFTAAGSVFSSGSTNATELANCHCNQYTYVSGFFGSYTQMLPTIDPTNATDNFDDIVTFKEPWQMQTPAVPPQAKNCLFIMGRTPQYLYEFNLSGTFLTEIGYYGAATNQFGFPNQIATDASGNFWVADTGNNRVLKLDGTGNWLLTIPPSGCSYTTPPSCTASGLQGSFSNDNGIAIDQNGNVWVSDLSNHRVQEFSSSGTFISQIPSSGCTNTSTPPACPASGSNGQFYYPNKMAIDSNNNLWVADGEQSHLQEFSTAGVWMQTIGTAGAGNTNFSNPQDITFDPQGNIWVADYGNNRLQQLTPQGAYLQTIPNTGCQTSTVPACPASVATGQFYEPVNITFAPDGSMWVSDQNNRLQHLSVGVSGAQFLSSIPAASLCTGTSPPSCPISGSGGYFNNFSPASIVLR